jgi:hypothetical protein
MSLQQEEIPLQTEVRAQTADGFAPTVTHDTDSSYERFLELPVPIVLLTLWLVGVALISLCVSVLFLLRLLLGVAAGAA